MLTKPPLIYIVSFLNWNNYSCTPAMLCQLGTNLTFEPIRAATSSSECLQDHHLAFLPRLNARSEAKPVTSL
jgi:hypothetical protein